ncbi:response regulator transcription factor [Azospirillum sp.]|uniref:response regulator transcription factor n=1 Tax=Azospirillum sp. TaxID=34012 RepID=UPI002D3B6814|nr:response regulator transcription factor [Azospirillum sp.]HYD68719.1 response regulator transcription factor [Azospirillum sp.]
MIDVVAADKSPLVTRALVRLFEEDERFNLLATATDGERFLEACGRFPFRVGVIGWDMPFVNGRGVLERLKGRPGAPRIVVYTGIDAGTVVRSAMALGAAGFCSKSEPPERLLDVCASVAAGRMAFPFIDVHSLNDNPLDTLTARERVLLDTLASGRTNAQLARELGISVHTVKFHLKNLYDKLGIGTRAQAVAMTLSGGRAP